MGKIRVGIIFGGRSGEHEISLRSARCVFDAIDRTRYDVSLIGIDRTGHWHVLEPPAFLWLTGTALAALDGSGSAVMLRPAPGLELVDAEHPATPIRRLDVVFP